MMNLPRSPFVDELRAMDEALTALIAGAERQQDFLLAALLSEAHDVVVARYSALVARS